MNIQYKKYREKNNDRIIEEINFLSDKYKMLNFQIIGNTLPIKDYKQLLKDLRDLGKDFNFVAEARADQFKSDDYTLLKDSGFTTIQTGIESFSKSYLKKMNKGTRVIDNIAALKYSVENGINNPYNLIINYPNEEIIDFEETKKNISFFQKFIDPPNICQLRIVFESPIYRNSENYNIEELTLTSIDKLMFPEKYLDKKLSFVYDCNKRENLSDNNWHELINNWKKIREQKLINEIKSGRDIDRFIFYFVDGVKFIKIYDKRCDNNIQIYTLNDIEREIFLSCKDVKSYKKLREEFNNLSEDDLNEILKTFIQLSIFFSEDNFFLSLPLDYSKCMGIRNSKQKYKSELKENVICSLNYNN